MNEGLSATDRRAESAAYYQAHREELAAYRYAHRAERKAYRESRKEETRAYNEAYRQAHRAEGRAYSVAYEESHKEERKAYYRSNRDHSRKRAAKRHRWFAGNLQILRATQGCDDCGTHEGRLEHHHIDPSTRLWEVSQMCGHSLGAFLDEIAKCVVLCGPCHRARHAEMRAAV